jgi:manganese/zinc/iron transport system permease protein
MENVLSIFQDYTFQIVAIGTGILGLMSGVIGSFTTLQKESLLGDALSHAALPGVVIGFMLIGRKEWLFLLGGAAISGLIATGLIQWMSKSEAIKFDNALSLILSSFFGLGLVLLTYVQQQSNANQAGLENFIYGQASSMLYRDVKILAITSVIGLFLIIVFWKELKLYTFDKKYAKTLGLNTTVIQLIISSVMIVTIILGLESVGVILMSGLLVGPAVGARQWTNRLDVMVLLAGIFGLFSGVTGTLISSMYTQIPTGPSIVVVLSLIVFFSLLFAPRRGILATRRDHRLKRKEYSMAINKDVTH